METLITFINNTVRIWSLQTWISGIVWTLVGVTLRIMATTSLSFSLQSSFWTQKSSFCSSCLSAGRRSEERNLGSNWHSLYLRVRKVCLVGCRTDLPMSHWTKWVWCTWHWQLGHGLAPVLESGNVCWSIFWRKSLWQFHKHLGTSDDASSCVPEPDLRLSDCQHLHVSCIPIDVLLFKYQSKSARRTRNVLTLYESPHHLLTLLLFAVVAQECAECASCRLLYRQHFLQPKQQCYCHRFTCGMLWDIVCSMLWRGVACGSAHIGGEDNEDARWEALV